MPVFAADSPRISTGASWRFAVAFVAAWPLAVLLANPDAYLPLKLEIGAVLLTSAVSPPAGLLLVTVLAPLGDMLAPVYGPHPIANTEAIVLAFLVAWFCGRALSDGSRPTFASWLTLALSTFTAIVVASVASTLVQLHRASPADFGATVRGLAQSYLWFRDLVGAHVAANLLEGLAILAAAADLVRRNRWLRPALAWTLIAGGVAGVIASALLAKGMAPTATIARWIAAGLPRYSATVADVNAAGSWYVLLFGVSLGALLAPRVRARLAAGGAAGALVFGMWLTGSRAAFAAVAILLSAGGFLWLRQTSRRLLWVIGIIVVGAAVLGAASLVVTRGAEQSLGMRAGFAIAALRVFAARPLLGVGIGRYYPLSELVLPPALAWEYGRENAHDYYLQLLAELGIVGLLAFLWVIAAAFRPLVQRVRRGSEDYLGWGLVIGACGYLLTALGGHPLLLLETALPFWTVAGIAASEENAAAPARVRVRAGLALLAAVVIATAPLRPGVPDVRLAPRELGLEPSSSDGISRAGRFASVYVGRNASGVELRLRADGERVLVRIAVPQWSEHKRLLGSDWLPVFITMPGAAPLVPEQRINLKVEPSDGSATRSPAAQVQTPRVVWTR